MKPRVIPKKIYKNSEEYFNDAVLYFKNAKEILRNTPIENGIYKNAKLTRKACAIGYLSVLLAIDGFLVQAGMSQDRLPHSIDTYFDALKKYGFRDGKVKNWLIVVYQNLHILGYYRGGIGIGMIKEGFNCAKSIIEKITGKRID